MSFIKYLAELTENKQPIDDENLQENAIQNVGDVITAQLTVEAMEVLLGVIALANGLAESPKEYLKNISIIKSAITKADNGHIKIEYTYEDKSDNKYYHSKVILNSTKSDDKPTELKNKEEATKYKMGGLQIKNHSHTKKEE